MTEAKDNLENDLEMEIKLDADEEARGKWGNGIEFFLSCIGYAVGIGNIWRFPYVCMRNGGGAFLIPFLLFLMLCGMPLFFMELVLGQFSNLSPITVWNICPLFKGLGFGMVIISGIVCVYFNVLMAYALYYLVYSFTQIPGVPWDNCDNVWNSANCFSNYANGTINGSNATTVSASADFWLKFVLQKSSKPEEIGDMHWQLLACLAVAWLIIFCCLAKGVQSSGKVVYITATAPYILLTVLLFRGITLPGSWTGLKFFLVPDFAKLLSPRVWMEACLQIFFSLGPAWGGLITMASYNKFNYNCYRDAILVSCMDAGTCLLGGLVIFSVLGYMADLQGLTVNEVATQGPGLAFIVYPAAISTLPYSFIWSVVFFLMLLTLNIDTQFGMFETLVSGVQDQFPGLRHRKSLVTASLATVEFLLGIPLVMQGGSYLFYIMDFYAAALSVTIIAFLECVVIAYIYGVDRFFEDIKLMLGYYPHVIWKYFWKYITPVLLGVNVIFNFASQAQPTWTDENGKEKPFPTIYIVVGWILASLSLIPIPLFMILKIMRNKSGDWKDTLKPTEKWRPADPSLRAKYAARWRHYRPCQTSPLCCSKAAKSQEEAYTYTGDAELAALKVDFIDS